LSWSLSIYGHDAPSEDVKTAVREAFANLERKAGANGGSLSGQGNDGEPISISFPEPVADPTETTDEVAES
jgi:hypothetical protein